MRKVGIVAAATGMALLGGCAGFPGALGLGGDEPVALASVDVSSYFAQRLEDGRRELRANRPASAITAFRQASYHPDFAGPAYNGMAISYDMIGRFDLAQRFFAAAVEAAPEDARFARNLERFEVQQVARSFAAAERQLAAAEPMQEATNIPAAPAATVEQARAGRITGESVPPRPDDPSRVASTRLGRNERRASVVHVGAMAGRGDYPVRIALSDVAEQPSATPSVSDHETRETPLAAANGSVSIRVSGRLNTRRPTSYPVTFSLAPR